ncbi:MAG: hypothetical protein J3K34DRAFT_522214 [Monoraphidium minutum]|nr:MAG: hypothetical protein J3K34DRAFT_522214 [Monoraphidium minutum]
MDETGLHTLRGAAPNEPEPLPVLGAAGWDQGLDPSYDGPSTLLAGAAAAAAPRWRRPRAALRGAAAVAACCLALPAPGPGGRGPAALQAANTLLDAAHACGFPTLLTIDCLAACDSPALSAACAVAAAAAAALAPGAAAWLPAAAVGAACAAALGLGTGAAAAAAAALAICWAAGRLLRRRAPRPCLRLLAADDADAHGGGAAAVAAADAAAAVADGAAAATGWRIGVVGRDAGRGPALLWGGRGGCGARVYDAVSGRLFKACAGAPDVPASDFLIPCLEVCDDNGAPAAGGDGRGAPCWPCGTPAAAVLRPATASLATAAAGGFHGVCFPMAPRRSGGGGSGGGGGRGVLWAFEPAAGRMHCCSPLPPAARAPRAGWSGATPPPPAPARVGPWLGCFGGGPAARTAQGSEEGRAEEQGEAPGTWRVETSEDVREMLETLGGARLGRSLVFADPAQRGGGLCLVDPTTSEAVPPEEVSLHVIGSLARGALHQWRGAVAARAAAGATGAAAGG